jgi:hypothetical protein
MPKRTFMSITTSTLTSPVPVPMWQGWAQFQCDVGGGEPESQCRCGASVGVLSELDWPMRSRRPNQLPRLCAQV